MVNSLDILSWLLLEIGRGRAANRQREFKKHDHNFLLKKKKGVGEYAVISHQWGGGRMRKWKRGKHSKPMSQAIAKTMFYPLSRFSFFSLFFFLNKIFPNHHFLIFPRLGFIFRPFIPRLLWWRAGRLFLFWGAFWLLILFFRGRSLFF